MKKKIKRIKKEKIPFAFLVVASIFAISMLFYSINSLFFNKDTHNEVINPMKSESRMSLTSYDVQLARKLMDKDNDGKCDSCGMPVEMCIDSGELQCTMDSRSTIGKLGSQHIHADWKIFIDEKQFDFTVIGDRHERQMHGDKSIKDTSAFMHIHPADDPEKTGDVLHMHATGVPLWIFFESIEMKLPDGMKVYVNEKEIPDYKNYVFNDLDKILITDGTGDLEEQLSSITNFAEKH